MQDAFSVSKGAIKLDTKGIIEGYRERYDTLIKTHKFSHMAYRISPGDRIMVHVKVPSETVDNVNYDVLLELSADKAASTFGDCDVKVFSNCPSFVYTYAYIFAHWDPDQNKPTGRGRGMMIDAFKGKLPRDRMLIPGSEKQLGRRPIKEEPVVRNPMGIPLFDKSIYYAVFYLNDSVEFSSVINNHNNVAISRVFAAIQNFDTLMSSRERLEKRQASANKAKYKDIQKDFEIQEKNLAVRNSHGMKKPASMIHASSAHTTTLKPKSPRSPKTTRK